MEWWLWLIIIGSVILVGVILYMLLAGDEEEAVEEEKVAEMEDVLDLTDAEVLKGLAKDGFQLTVGKTVYWSVSEAEAVKGYSWIFNEDCDGLMSVDILEGPPMKEEAAEGDEKEAEKEEGAEEKEEKRLRDGHSKPSDEDKARAKERADAGETIYLAVTGAKAGSCVFAGVYNESWDWTIDRDEQAEDATFVTFDLTVAEAAEEGAEEEGAEEKAE